LITTPIHIIRAGWEIINIGYRTAERYKTHHVIAPFGNETYNLYRLCKMMGECFETMTLCIDTNAIRSDTHYH
jgi:hypothetical protein